MGPPGTTTLKITKRLIHVQERVLEWPRESLTGKQKDQRLCRGSTREADGLESHERTCHARVPLRMTENFPG